MAKQGIEIRTLFKHDKEPLWPELKGKKTQLVKIDKMSIIEGGTIGGKTSIILLGEHEGELLCFQLASDILNKLNESSLEMARSFGEDL